jgi:hypothetical protein
MTGRALDAERRKSIREARKALLMIEPRKILWGDLDRESVPRSELAGAREDILLGFEVQAPNIAYDGSNYWLIVGEATLAVALDLGVRTLPTYVHMGGRDDVARSRERIARFRTENDDDPDFLAATPEHQRVKIRVPAKGQRKVEVDPGEADSSTAEPEPRESEPIPVESPPSPSSSTFSDQVRAIIRQDGRTIYAIETAAGVPRGGVGRFLSGERGLTTDTLDRLAGVLGMRVIGPDRGD